MPNFSFFQKKLCFWQDSSPENISKPLNGHLPPIRRPKGTKKGRLFKILQLGLHKNVTTTKT